MDERSVRADLMGAEECLRVVLTEINTGKILADLDHVAYLRGAADTMAILAGSCPETKISGCGQHAATGETFPQEG